MFLVGGTIPDVVLEKVIDDIYFAPIGFETLCTLLKDRKIGIVRCDRCLKNLANTYFVWDSLEGVKTAFLCLECYRR